MVLTAVHLAIAKSSSNPAATRKRNDELTRKSSAERPKKKK
jgi:hypothetical protein